MTHTYREASDPNTDPSYNARLRGKAPLVDDTELSSKYEGPEVVEEERKLTTAEKMQLIQDRYGFLPVSDSETSRVYSIGKRQGQSTPLGVAARRLLQDVHRHQMYTATEDTSSAVRALTHDFEDSAKHARRRRHFTEEFESMLQSEIQVVGSDEFTVLQVLHDGRAIQYADGPKLGLRYLGEYIAQSNKLTHANSPDAQLLPKDPMELIADEALELIKKAKISNVARLQFWNTVVEGAAQHTMAHRGLRESIIVER